MKADSTDLTKLLDLQGLDSGIEQLKRKAAALPVHAQIADLTARRTAIGQDLTAAKTAVSDATATAERAEADVTPVRERLARNQARVQAGEMDAKALTSALDEIEHLKKRVSDLEDNELAALDALDAANERLARVTAAAETVDADLRELVAARDAQGADLAGQARALAERRAGLAGTIDPALLGLYEKIRARANGLGAARLDGRRCAACGLEATVADYDRYVAAAPDEVLRCAECDRILVR